MNIVFFGTPEFAKIILEKLIKSDYKPAIVVTAPDKPVGRKREITPSLVKSLAASYELQATKILQPEKLSTISNQLSAIRPDLFIVAAYGKILPKELLNIPKHGGLNVHPSLLPRWRGPSPIQYTILNNDKKTGVTIMLMDEKMDHGPLLSQREFLISNFEFLNGKGRPTAKELHDILAEMGAELLIDTIPKWVKGEIQPKEQDHSLATFSKIITKEDGLVDWEKPAEEIERMLRAFTPWPGIFTYWKGKRLKLLSVTPSPDIHRGLPLKLRGRIKEGVIIFHNNTLAVQTGQGLLVVEELQLEGGRPMPAKEFLKGHPEIVGAKLGI